MLTSMTNYNTLSNDMIAGTSRTLADGDTVNASYIIYDIGDAKPNNGGLIFADIVFIEA